MHRMRQSLQLLHVPPGTWENTHGGEALWMSILWESLHAPSLPSWTPEDTQQGESLHMHSVSEGFPLALLKEACANAQWGEALRMSAVWESLLVPHKPARTYEDTHRGATLNTRPLGEISLSLQTWNVSSALEQNLVNGTLWENLQVFTYFIHKNSGHDRNLLMDINMVFPS